MSVYHEPKITRTSLKEAIETVLERSASTLTDEERNFVESLAASRRDRSRKKSPSGAKAV